jgi:hypothetical protein
MNAQRGLAAVADLLQPAGPGAPAVRGTPCRKGRGLALAALALACVALPAMPAYAGGTPGATGIVTCVENSMDGKTLRLRYDVALNWLSEDRVQIVGRWGPGNDVVYDSRLVTADERGRGILGMSVQDKLDDQLYSETGLLTIKPSVNGRTVYGGKSTALLDAYVVPAELRSAQCEWSLIGPLLPPQP